MDKQGEWTNRVLVHTLRIPQPITCHPPAVSTNLFLVAGQPSVRNLPTEANVEPLVCVVTLRAHTMAAVEVQCVVVIPRACTTAVDALRNAVLRGLVWPRRLRGGSGNGNRERAAYEMGVAMGTGTVEVYASVYHSTEQEWISAEVVMSPQSTTVMFLKVVAVVT